MQDWHIVFAGSAVGRDTTRSRSCSLAAAG
jgi:hypothetical protein